MSNEEISGRYEDTGLDRVPVMELCCSRCGVMNLVEVLGFLKSGGEVRLRSLKRNETLEIGQTFSTSSTISPHKIIEIISHGYVDVWEDLSIENTVLLFQVYHESKNGRHSLCSWARGVTSELADLIRYSLHWATDPRYARLFLDLFDSTTLISEELKRWRPEKESKLPIPTILDMDMHLMSKYGQGFWHNLRDVRSVYLFHVFLAETDGSKKVMVRARGITQDPDHGDVECLMWEKGLYETRKG